MSVHALRLLPLLLSVVTASASLAQTAADALADTALYVVSYVEVTPSSKMTAIAALKQYRESSRKQEGCIGLEIFEQIDRPGHFALVETWRGLKAFDARGAAAQTDLLATLQPIRVSHYDQRAYKTLTVGRKAAVRDIGATRATAPEYGDKPRPMMLPVTNRTVISVITHVDIAPAGRQILEVLTRLAEASRQDEGNLRFDVLQNATRANHFTVIETWQTLKALDAHAAAAHTRQYRDEVQPMTGSPLDERLYKAVK